MHHNQHLSSQNICIHYLPAHRHRVSLYSNNLLYIRNYIMTDNEFLINVNVHNILL